MTLVRAKNLQSLKVYLHSSPLERVSKDLCQGQFCTGVYFLHIKKCNLNSLYFSSLKQSWILFTVWSPHQSILHPLFHRSHEIREASCFFPDGLSHSLGQWVASVKVFVWIMWCVCWNSLLYPWFEEEYCRIVTALIFFQVLWTLTEDSTSVKYFFVSSITQQLFTVLTKESHNSK